MLMQAEMTEVVIDRVLRLPQSVEMLTHDEIRAELIRQIDAGLVKQASAARYLNIAPARVAEIRKGVRRIQPDEMPKLAEFLGMVARSTGRTYPIDSVTRIPNLGKVAQGVWLEQSESDPDNDDTVVYDRMAGDPPPTDLFAVTPEGTSMNLRFMPGTRLICRRLPFGVAAIKPGDYVIVERTAHELSEMTCKRLEQDDDGNYWLHSESSDEKYREPWFIGKPDNGHFTDLEVRMLGKVIRAVQDFENVRH